MLTLLFGPTHRFFPLVRVWQLFFDTSFFTQLFILMASLHPNLYFTLKTLESCRPAPHPTPLYRQILVSFLISVDLKGGFLWSWNGNLRILLAFYDWTEELILTGVPQESSRSPGWTGWSGLVGFCFRFIRKENVKGPFLNVLTYTTYFDWFFFIWV